MGDKNIPSWVNFILSGSAGMLASCCIQPLNLLKIRMQLRGIGKKQRNLNTFRLFMKILRKEGFFELYNGLSAALLRQATYTSIRLGGYQQLDQILINHNISTTNFATKLGMGLVTGALGGFSCTPAEVALIRMASDGQKPPKKRRNYKNIFDALFQIYRGEGITGLWRGAMPTIGRAMVVNASQISTYFQLKEYFISTGYFKDNPICHFTTTIITGPVTCSVSLPVDIAKTRIQNMRFVNGVPEYKGTLDVLNGIIKKEGIFSLWKGFTPYYLRIGPHTTLTFLFLEQLKNFYKKAFNK